jgi:hypothetical protein
VSALQLSQLSPTQTARDVARRRATSRDVAEIEHIDMNGSTQTALSRRRRAQSEWGFTYLFGVTSPSAALGRAGGKHVRYAGPIASVINLSGNLL